MNLLKGIIFILIGIVTTIGYISMNRYIELVFTIPLIAFGVYLISRSKHIKTWHKLLKKQD